MALPAIRDTEGGVELTFGEKPRFCFEIGSDQRPASDDGDCGDCCDCVGLEDGRNVIILSDGMGTGRRAAVDSAMATDLSLRSSVRGSPARRRSEPSTPRS